MTVSHADGRLGVQVEDDGQGMDHDRRLAGGLDMIGKIPVQKFITTDGYKFLLPNNEWVAFRASGTEPLIRAYIEAKSESQLRKLEASSRQILTE